MKLLIHMKSGKTITVRNVKDWKIEYTGNEVTSIKIERGKSFWPTQKGLIIKSIALDQIEAMERY